MSAKCQIQTWPESFTCLVGDLAAPHRKNSSVPNNRDSKRKNEGLCRSERHSCEMQNQQRCAEAGKTGNGVRQYRGCRGTTDAAMQDNHDTRVDYGEYRKHAASRRTNSGA